MRGRLIVSLVAQFLIVGSAWANSEHVVRIGVTGILTPCPSLYRGPCVCDVAEPVRGVRVTIRTSDGEIKVRRRTNSKGMIATRLRDGRYVASINLPGFRRPFIVRGSGVTLSFAMGEATVEH